MNIIELAKECGIEATEKDLVTFSKAFAQAVIDDYKASLVPVAYVEYVWITDVDGLQSPERNLLDYDNGNCEPLFALPSGETK